MFSNRQTLFFAAFATISLGLFFFFKEAWVTMAQVWWGNETYSHGLLILPISAWLVWRNRATFSTLHLSPSWFGFVGLCLGAFCWLLGNLAAVRVVQHLGVVIMLAALVPLVFGLQLSKALMFPIGFLFFMVPAGEFMVPTLMKHTADMTILALQLSGIPVFRENMHFTLPTGRWSVVEACSGLRYIIAALVLAFMFAYLNYKSWAKKTLFVVVCLAVAIVANWVRAYLVVLVGHFSGMKYGTGDDHVYYGWFFFGVVMFTIFWFGARSRDKDMDEPAGVLVSKNRQMSSTQPPSQLYKVGLALAFSIATMLIAQSMPKYLNNTVVAKGFEAGLKQATGMSVATKKLELLPKFVQPSSVYKGEFDGVELFGAYYAAQTDTIKMITGDNFFLSSSDLKWNIISSKQRGESSFFRTASVDEMVVKNQSQSRLAWSFYCVGGHCVRGQSLAKALTAYATLMGKGDHSMAFLISTPIIEGNVERAREKLSAMWTKTQDFGVKFPMAKPVP